MYFKWYKIHIRHITNTILTHFSNLSITKLDKIPLKIKFKSLFTYYNSLLKNVMLKGKSLKTN